MGRKKELLWAFLLLQWAALSASSLSPTNSTQLSQDFEVEMTAAGEEELSSTQAGTPVHGPEPVPTWRPKRPNCTPPAIEQFPRPLIGPSGRKHGGLILHIIVCVYSFIGLAIICDDYFVTSLDRICEALKLTPDVAGATFMAAGSSAPELATVVIGVFFAQDDIGVSGVIGSAVFNIMFVIAVCGLCTSTASALNWWPLSRDCFAYAISILIMLFVIFDDAITWGESLFMLIAYVCYCVALAYNSVLERWAQTLPIPCNTPEFQANMHREQLASAPPTTEDQKLVSYKNLQEKQNYSTMEGGDDEWGVPPPVEPLANGAAEMSAPQPPAQLEYYRAQTNQNQVTLQTIV